MTTKAAVKTSKTKASKATSSKSSKAARKQTKANGSPVRQSSATKATKRSSATGKFVADKTGRVVKSSPVTPRAGKERIQIAVKSYVRRTA